MDINDTSKHKGLISAVSDIMMKNQNLYQQDFEKQYGVQHATPAEVEAITAGNAIETPDPVSDPESVDPDSVIDGASGLDGQE